MKAWQIFVKVVEQFFSFSSRFYSFVYFFESSLSVENTCKCLDPQKQIFQYKTYIQTIDMWNDKYKQYPNWQNTKP